MIVEGNIIDKLNGEYKKYNESAKAIREMSRPAITDRRQIAVAFGAMSALDVSKDAKLFVILLLSSPSALAGCKMRNGLRKFISDMFEYNSPNAISNRCKDLYFRYKTYAKMQSEVGRSLDVIERILSLR